MSLAILIAQSMVVAHPAFAETATTLSDTEARRTVNELMQDDVTMTTLNQNASPAVDCMSHHLSDVDLGSVQTKSEVAAFGSRVLDAQSACSADIAFRAAALTVSGKFPNLTSTDALEIARGVLMSQALIGAQLEYTRSHPCGSRSVKKDALMRRFCRK